MKKENFFFVVDNFFKQDYFEKLKNKVIQQNYLPRTVDYRYIDSTSFNNPAINPETNTKFHQHY